VRACVLCARASRKVRKKTSKIGKKSAHKKYAKTDDVTESAALSLSLSLNISSARAHEHVASLVPLVQRKVRANVRSRDPRRKESSPHRPVLELERTQETLRDFNDGDDNGGRGRRRRRRR